MATLFCLLHAAFPALPAEILRLTMEFEDTLKKCRQLLRQRMVAHFDCWRVGALWHDDIDALLQWREVTLDYVDRIPRELLRTICLGHPGSLRIPVVLHMNNPPLWFQPYLLYEYPFVKPATTVVRS